MVIGRRAWRVPEARARDYILGLTCVNDVTARELQARDVQFTRAKGFDTFAPIGPCVALGFDGRPVRVEGRVNGERRQASDTSRLIFPIERLVAFVSSVMTLLPGDVIATGTPSGIAPRSSSQPALPGRWSSTTPLSWTIVDCSTSQKLPTACTGVAEGGTSRSATTATAARTRARPTPAHAQAGTCLNTVRDAASTPPPLTAAIGASPRDRWPGRR